MYYIFKKLQDMVTPLKTVTLQKAQININFFLNNPLFYFIKPI